MSNCKDIQIKILVVGDSGVGKTHLSSILTDVSGSMKNAQCNWTIGANVEILIHKYKQGTAEEDLYFCELWDVSGNLAHTMSRSVFFNQFHGVIFVHNLTNRKSLENIRGWSEEVLDGDQESGANVPLILVGTRMNDVMKEKKTLVEERSRRMAEELGSVLVNLDCSDKKALSPGSAVKIGAEEFVFALILTLILAFSKFFDRVVDQTKARQQRAMRISTGWSTSASTSYRGGKKSD